MSNNLNKVDQEHGPKDAESHDMGDLPKRL